MVRGFASDERGVSPVIGTVLILFIILLAMAGILAWGVPAIQGLQDHAEFQSVLTQAHELNADLLKLRDAKAASIAYVSMNQGELRVGSGARWIVTAYLDSNWEGLYYTNWENGAQFLANGVPGASTMTYDLATLSFTAIGSSPETCAAGTCGAVGSAGNVNMTALANPVVRIQFKVGNVLKAESWVFNTGRVTYKLDANSEYNRIHIELGAVFTQQGSAVFVDRKPTVKEPDLTNVPSDKSYLVRAFQVWQTASNVVVGKGRHTVNVQLDDNHGTTRGRPFLQGATAVRLQVDDGGAPGVKGILEEGFCNYFAALPSYAVQGGTTCAGGTVSVLYDPVDPFNYELSQAVVRTNVKAV